VKGAFTSAIHTQEGLFRSGRPRHQRADGSWANAENLVKEDDPLIASAFAVRALIAPP
jgi:hypothetical protein